MTVHKAKIMRDGIREQLPTGGVISDHLTAVSQGMSAETIDTIPDGGSIVTLPQFANITYDAQPLVNLIQWDAPTTLVLADDEERAIRWRIEDSTYATVSGELLVRPDVEGHVIEGDIPPAGVRPDARSYWTSQEGRRLLDRISKHGQDRVFELTRRLIPFARVAVSSASLRVHREIHEASNEGAMHVLDEIEREQVLDVLLWGSERSNGSVVTREIRRCAATQHTLRKSVMLLLATKLWSSAETYVRQHIGDPHLGRVIRRLARSLGTIDPNEVHAAYREQNPEARVGLSRVTAALTAGATLHTSAVPFADLEGIYDAA